MSTPACCCAAARPGTGAGRTGCWIGRLLPPASLGWPRSSRGSRRSERSRRAGACLWGRPRRPPMRRHRGTCFGGRASTGPSPTTARWCASRKPRACAIWPGCWPILGDAGEMLDATAKAAYKARLDELQTELDEADSFNDPVRVANTRQEMDFLVGELARAVGLGGRDRRAASHAERARLNATRAIRAAMANVARANPTLGRHLSATIRTGRYCSYTPDPRAPIDWEL